MTSSTGKRGTTKQRGLSLPGSAERASDPSAVAADAADGFSAQLKPVRIGVESARPAFELILAGLDVVTLGYACQTIAALAGRVAPLLRLVHGRA